MLRLAGVFRVAAPFDAVTVRQGKGINLRFYPRQYIAGCFVTERVGIGLHRQHPAAVPAQDQRIFPLQRKAAHHVAQRNILLTILAPHQHVIEMVCVLTLAFWRAHDNGQQVRTFTV
ncbi:hypothetical protein D3C85_1496590 [compost metagenome]